MSNTELREGAPKTRREMERFLRRAKMVQQAVDQLYLLEGGRTLDQLIAICRRTLDGAYCCREDDARRLRENPKVTWREKGERPLVTVTEQRLHSNLMFRYMQEKQALRGIILTRINEAINAFQPDSDEDLQALLDGLIAAATPGASLRDEAMLTELLPQLPEQDRKDFVAALELKDDGALKEVLARQPEEVRKRFAPLAA